MELKEISQLFGSREKPALLRGGQGNTYKSGNIILKPTDNPIESNELAEITNNIKSSNELRIQKPVKSVNGNWIENGYVAWEYLKGADLENSMDEKIQVCNWFSEIFINIEKPNFIDKRNDSWSIADRVSWEEVKKEYDSEFQKIINVVKEKLEPLNLPNEVIHGDIGGNIIFDEEEGLGVIDLTLYWRPKDFAKAILLLDGILWSGADESDYNLIKDLPDIDQLLLRAGLRRIIEQVENITYLGKNKEDALKEAGMYFNVMRELDLL